MTGRWFRLMVGLTDRKKSRFGEIDKIQFEGNGVMTTRGSAISWLVLLTATMLAAATVAATARSDYPNRTVKIVVPTPPGAILDILPRIIADKLSARWGQSIVIENRPGAAQNLGAEAVAKAEPDGYTLLITPPGPLVISQYYYAKLGFDPTAFVPVTIMVTVPPLLVVNPNVPVSTIEEFIAYAKANPNKMTYGSPGPGSTPQLAMEKLMSAAGIWPQNRSVSCVIPDGVSTLGIGLMSRASASHGGV